MSGRDAARWARVEAVLTEALERAPEHRPAFLDEACADDAELRREVEELLAAHAETGLFDEVVRSSDTSQGSEMDHPAGTRFGPYAVEGLLGRGGMGVVYLARRVDGEFEQEVALKVLPAGLVSDRLEERFRAERQILARLSHPNVARLLDGGVDDAGRPWFAMERVRGTSLVEYCDTEGLGLDDRLDLYLTVCDAVQHAHQNLVVHRDLKPGNILVDENGTPRLLDFGIAKLLDPEAPGPGARETQVGVRVLTPAYAAPEQLRGEPANTASDVFQLGILLYELLTGVHPFPERTTGSPTPSRPSMRAVTKEATRPSAAVTTREEAQARGLSPKLLSQRLKGDLDAIVLKALREEPERRYASAAELAEDLRRHRARRPVRARPDTWAYRTGRFVRRNAVAMGAGAMVVAGVTAFTAGIAREAHRTALQRDRAEAVSAFMEGLFASASPYAGAGEEVTARDLLDDGARRAREQLGDQPVIQATLLDVIGDAYWELGLAEEGLALRLEGLERWREQAKASAEYRIDLLDAMARTGSYLARDGKMEASRALLEEAEALLAALPGDVAWERADVLNDLGMGWQVQGDFDRAEPFLEGAAEGFRQLPGQELSAAAAMGNLGWLRIERSDPDSAEALFAGALTMRREALGPDHLFVANTLEGLGNLYVLTGRLAQADTAYRESLRIRQAGLPEDHYLVHSSAMGLARVVGRRGDAVQADSLFRSAIAGLVRTFGEASAATAYARNEHAIFLRDQGLTAEAVAEFGRAEEGYRVVYGADHINRALVGANRAWALFLDGRPAEAASTFEAVLPVILEADGGSGRFLRNQVEYGIVLCNDGHPDRGVQTLREAVEILERASPGEDQLLRGKNALGECLGIARLPEEAEPVLLEVLEATEGRPADDPYRAFARRTLERVYRAQGRDDDARRIREGR